MKSTNKMVIALFLGSVFGLLTFLMIYGHMFDLIFLPWWTAIFREIFYIFSMMCFGASFVYAWIDDGDGEDED